MMMALVQLAGYVALLLWGARMVQSGVVRAYGADLRRMLSLCLRNRVSALLSGIGVTALLQSSTATGLMATSFVASGVIDLLPALAVMLGANIGTTLIVQVLSFDISWMAPVLFLVGLLAFRRSRTRTHDLGRVAIGLGLMLLSLHLLVATIEPAETAPAMRAVFVAFAGEPILALLLAAVLTWAAHSSAAIVLLTMSLAGIGVVSPAEALALVLGANLGSALNPLIEGVAGGNPAHRRLPLGNLATRVVGCALFLPFLQPIADLLMQLEAGAPRLVANFHTAFNLVLAVAFLGLLGPMARLLQRLLPAKPGDAAAEAARHLHEEMLDTPTLALANAEREIMRVVDIVETMLRETVAVFERDDRRRIQAVEQMNRTVDRLAEAIKHYLVHVEPEHMRESESRRYGSLLAYAIDLAHVGDILEKNLMEAAAKKEKRRLSFSPEGAAEIRALLARQVDCLRLSLAVLLSGDIVAARRLVQEKETVRGLEQQATDNHLRRLREGRPETMETSALHLDILRDARRITAHLAAAANPVLQEHGQLRANRLVDAQETREGRAPNAV